MPSPIKVGIIGYGFSARTFHIPFIKSNPDLVIHSFLQRGDVPHVRGSPASSCEDDFPSAKRYRTADSFFDDKETELVIITTGHASHAELAEKALKAGMNGECKPETEAAQSQLTPHSRGGEAVHRNERGG